MNLHPKKGNRRQNLAKTLLVVWYEKSGMKCRAEKKKQKITRYLGKIVSKSRINTLALDCLAYHGLT